MPISAADPRYRAEFEPPEILAMRPALCALYSRPASSFGARGDLNHASGYHRSFNWVTQSPDSRHGWDDYSVRNALDNEGLDRNACSAFDFIPGDWGTAENRHRMVELTARLHAAAKARDPRIANLREVAGTLDGKTVVTFNCADGTLKSPFDSSHLDHIHGSFWRSRARRDHTGLLTLLIGDAEDMDANQAQQLANIHDWLFDLCRGIVAADPGTPHILTYAPNRDLALIKAQLDVLLRKADLTDEDLQKISDAAELGASTGAPGPSAAEIRKIVDEELDEAFTGGADTDPPN